jgi:hypothetical protein
VATTETAVGQVGRPAAVLDTARALPPSLRTVERVRIERLPSLESLIATHQKRLVCFGGEVITDRAVLEAQRERMEAVWNALPAEGSVLDIPEVRLGRSDRSFSPYTQIEEHHPPLDPINLVFWGDAPVDRVAGVLCGLPEPWIDSALVKGTTMRCPLGAMPQAMWVRPQSAGAEPRFVWCAYSLSPQGFELERIHVRLFEGGTDPAPGGWGRWSVGAVHREVVEPGELDHTVRHWDAAQDEAVAALSASLGRRAEVSMLRLQEDGEVLRGVSHDGVAAAIRIV